MTVTIRATTPADSDACGRIMYDAFAGIAGSHGFPADFRGLEAATGLAQALIANPATYGIVAEVDGRVVGSNFLSEGDTIRGVGPITVDPKTQGSGVGRKLMQAVLERANGAAGVRLLQDGFNMGSIALYASLGFEVREPLVVMSGSPSEAQPAHTVVRPMTEADIPACDRLCEQVHGINRHSELVGAIQAFSPKVAVRDDRITAYMTAPTVWLANHGVAESEADMHALLLGAAADEATIAFLLPTRQASLFRWCLAQGMRAVKPMTLMSIGDYRVPEGAYMPSVFY